MFYYNPNNCALNRAVFLFLAVILICSFSQSVYAADQATATKTGGVSPGTTNSGFFTIPPPGQVVHWIANYFGSGTQGNDFYLHDDSPGSLLNQIALSTNLSSGLNQGDHFLPAGNYEISITYFGMGPGNYSITYNQTAQISASPLNHNFGDHNENTTSNSKSFTISNTGDLAVTLGNIVNSNPTYFEITDNPSGQSISPGGNDTLKVRFKAGSAGGSTVPVNRAGTLTVTASTQSGNPPVLPVSITVQGRTIPLLPDIATCYSGTFNIGTADHTIGETITGNVCFKNNGGAPLTILNITLINNQAGNAFSLNGTPSTAALAPNAARNVSVRFAPPAAGGEMTYTGSLQINSSDPDSPSFLCPFKAKAHHPVPKMNVLPNTLDYHEVELGFAFTKAFVIKNNGDATLTATVALDSAFSNTDQAHWSSLNLGTWNITAGQNREILCVYKPTNVASHQIHLKVTGNDLNNPSENVALHGEGIAPIPIDSSLVLDRSGSMSNPAGTVTKIKAMQTAADLFTHLLAQRNMGASPFGDKIGFVKYNHNNSDYLILNTVAGTHLTNAENALSDAAIADINKLKPAGTTWIGGAMQRSANMLLASPADRKQVMVVLTDGHENVSPKVGTVIGPIMTSNPDLKIYSVGLGSSHNPVVLQSITNIANGYHQVQDDLSGTSRFDLETFYFKIFANAAGMSLIVDPTHVQLLNSPNPQIVDTASISSSDLSVVFLALEVPVLRQFYDLELIDPHGQIIVPGSTVGGIPVHQMVRMNYRIFRVVFPDKSLAHTYVGTWKLRLTPNGNWDPAKIKDVMRDAEGYQPDWISPFQGQTPIGFAAAVRSNYCMAVQVLTNSYLPGADVTLTAKLTDRGWPAPGGDVTLTATIPGGTVYQSLVMYDDGSHGDTVANDALFTRKFPYTGTQGSYKFFFQGIGRNERGELNPREETRYLTLASPQEDPYDDRDKKPCVPCPVVIIILIVFLVLLIWILVLIRRK